MPDYYSNDEICITQTVRKPPHMRINASILLALCIYLPYAHKRNITIPMKSRGTNVMYSHNWFNLCFNATENVTQ